MKFMPGSQDFMGGIKKVGAPFSVAVMIITACVFLINYVTKGTLIPYLSLSGLSPGFPWTYLTYPLVAGTYADFFQLVFVLYALYLGGVIVENQLGTPKYAALFGALTLIGGILVYFAAAATGGLGLAFRAFWVPADAILIVWAATNPSGIVNFCMIIPVKLWLFAILVTLGNFFFVGYLNPYMGFAGTVPLGIAWLVGQNRIPFFLYRYGLTDPRRQSKTYQKKQDSYFDDVHRREKERDERERLRKLFESSLDDDKESGS